MLAASSKGLRARRSSDSSTWSTCWAGHSWWSDPMRTLLQTDQTQEGPMPTTTTQQDSFRALRDILQTSLLASFPEHVARIGWSRAQIAAHQQHRLSALLAHAVEHSPFHARRL